MVSKYVKGCELHQSMVSEAALFASSVEGSCLGCSEGYTPSTYVPRAHLRNHAHHWLATNSAGWGRREVAGFTNHLGVQILLVDLASCRGSKGGSWET